MANKKRKNRHEEEEKLERWLVSYADFVTLLFAFFVSMYAISQVDVRKLGRATESLQTAFNIFKVTNAPHAVVDISDPKPIMTPPLNPIKPPQLPSNITKGEMERMENLKQMFKRIAQGTKGLGKNIRIVMGSRGLEIHLGNKILFPSGQATIRPEAFPLLDRLAQTLLFVPNLIRVEGHTDNIPISTPKFPSNWELSTARAASIVRYFVEHHNFSPLRLSASGYGEHRPIASNDTPEGRSSNRRVNIIILYLSVGDKEPNPSSS